VSNPGGGLPLMETFSRHTAKELSNRGYRTTALFNGEVNPSKLRRLLPKQDLFLWEGHYETLVKKYQLPAWDEPLQPSLIYLQSCLALNKKLTRPLLRHGAIGIVGASTRTFSGSGGAFTLAYFDALLYSNQSLGGGLRQAKNFMIAYAQLKEKRFGKKARWTGANVRSAWAFTLWGDPTLKLPRPELPPDALPAVKHSLTGKHIVVSLPAKPYDKVITEKYQAQMVPNGRLAGLLKKSNGEEPASLVPLLFAEIRLPKGPSGYVPELKGRLSPKRWVFTWDDRRRCGYLLIIHRDRDPKDLRFTVTWAKGTRPVARR
jgi:hypothetical protein